MIFSGTRGNTHEVVAEVGSRDAESPHGSDDERSSNGEQDNRKQLELGVVEERQLRLLDEGAVVQVVAEDPEREDGDGEGVAAPPRVVEREARQDLVAVFCDRVGRNASTRFNLGAGASNQVWTHLAERQCSRRAGSMGAVASQAQQPPATRNKCRRDTSRPRGGGANIQRGSSRRRSRDSAGSGRCTAEVPSSCTSVSSERRGRRAGNRVHQRRAEMTATAAAEERIFRPYSSSLCLWSVLFTPDYLLLAPERYSTA